MTRQAADRLGAAEIDTIRQTPGRSALLFLTDRCPVGCAHCSVDSRRDSPTITDFDLFGEIVDWLAAAPYDVVGITGGEPFVERRGLSLAVERLGDSGKRIVVYTSGTWATRARPPRWIAGILETAATVYLSTDAFHEEGVSDESYVHAACAIAAADTWIVVQVLDLPPMVERARALLQAAFGERFDEFAELRLTTPLTAGRGSAVFRRDERMPGHAFGPCASVSSPTIRYDGVVTACCNESLIMGIGPRRLRRQAGSKAELAAVTRAFAGDPLLRVLGRAGPDVLTRHPRFADLRHREFASICDVCWRMVARVEADEKPDPLLRAFDTVLVPAE